MDVQHCNSYIYLVFTEILSNCNLYIYLDHVHKRSQMQLIFDGGKFLITMSDELNV
jgi:hypothetical protein